MLPLVSERGEAEQANDTVLGVVGGIDTSLVELSRVISEAKPNINSTKAELAKYLWLDYGSLLAK